MTSSSIRGADTLVRGLQRAGVSKLFTLSGNHVMPVFDAAFGTGLQLIHTRHEAATVHMADAWARLTGEVGIALVTGGPGHANAVSALYTAQMAEAPVVLLSGHAPNNQRGMGAFQEMAQAEVAAPLTKASWACGGADALAGDLARAIRFARSGRPGPVHLSLPTDALEAMVDASALHEAEAFGRGSKDAEAFGGGPEGAEGPSRVDSRKTLSKKESVTAFDPTAMPLAAADAQALLARLGKARRPLILAGPACLTQAGRKRLDALQAACGVPVVGMESPRGTGDPSLGAFAEMLAQADTLLLLGKRLDFTLKFGQPPALRADCTVLQVDADDTEIARSRRAVGDRLAMACRADAFSAIDALIEAAAKAPRPAPGWADEVQAAVRYRPAAWESATANEPGRLHPVQACRPLQALLDSHPDAVFICDGGEIGQWAQACLSAPHRVINGVAGAIGAALPFALAARLAKPDAPVVAVLGDGTFGFHCAEFDTAVRYGLPFVAVVGNDARWNAEYQIQRRDYGPDRLIGCELLPSRYDRVAEAFGGHGEQVTAAAELLPAAQRAIASGLPACLNVMIEGVPAPNIRR